MSRYIDANLLKAEFTGNFTKAYAVPLIKSIIEQQPTADVQEVKHSRWEHYNDTARCVNCDHYTKDAYFDDNDEIVLPKYCSNCGAIMDLEDKE
nr:MAG TPA: Arv1-like family protein [Caudoviricetes sp.]